MTPVRHHIVLQARATMAKIREMAAPASASGSCNQEL
jgi:hypothetical protein